MAKRTRGDDDAPKAPITRDGLRQLARLLRYVYPYRLSFGLGLLCLALGSLVTLSFSRVLGGLVDAGNLGAMMGLPELPSRVMNGTRSWMQVPTDLDTLALLLVGLLVVQAGLSFARIVLFVNVTERALADLRRDLYARLIRLPMNFYVQRRVGELQSRLGSDIGQIGDTLTYTLAEMLRGLILFVVGLGLILLLSPGLTGVMLASFPVVVVAAMVFGRRIRKLSREATDQLAEANTVVEESLQGIHTVKAFTNEAHESGRYGRAIAAVVRASLRSGMWRAGFAAFIITALFGSIVLVLWYGSRQVQQGLLSVGELVTFFTVTMMVGASMAGFGEQFAQVQRALGATERVRQLLDEQPELTLPTRTVGANPGGVSVAAGVRVSGALAFEHVAFHYASRPEVSVLTDISFSLKAGQRVALVGASGAGKSTLVALLQRFYTPTEGRILIDGVPAEQYDLHELRRQMASVAQEVQLFGGTIAENLRYGKLDATDAELEHAAAQANALEFIRSFPDGLQTVVGERGIKLSGGQRQRIAIARALLRNPAILILDEATSSLDAESEAAVQEALDTLMRGRTTVVVAHRLATVRSADLILVLEGGRIVERGTHSELMLRDGGLYKSYATLQSLDVRGEGVLR